MLAGRDASYALATMSLSVPPRSTSSPPLTDLTASQRKVLLQWTQRFLSKYPVVGYLWPEATGMNLKPVPKGTKVEAVPVPEGGLPGSAASAEGTGSVATVEAGEVAPVDEVALRAARAAAAVVSKGAKD